MFAGPEFPSECTHHEEGKLSGSFGQDVCGIRERNFVLVSVGTVDVVEANRNLCHDFK